jgi:predicted glutamine amidotransferase
MCVIAVKPKNVEFPSDELITKMWNTNPDGAGFSYALDGAVYIEKGFMKLEELTNAINILKEKLKPNGITLKDIPFIMHFRITTHGGTSRGNTHPFPLSSKVEHLQALDVKAKMSIAHNGIITTVDREDTVSDTQIFIRDILYPLSKLDKAFTEKYKTLIKNTIGYSKLALLDYEENITLIGDFKEPLVKDGLSYSNLNHETRYYTPVATKKSTPKYWFNNDEYDYAESYEEYTKRLAPKEFVIGGLYVKRDSAMTLWIENHVFKFIQAWSVYSGEFLDMKTQRKVNITFEYLKPVVEAVVETKVDKEIRHRIGGRKNEETKSLQQSADRTKYKRKVFSKLTFVPLKKDNTFLAKKDIYKYLYKGSVLRENEYTVKIISDNWVYCRELNAILFKQKDDTYIEIDKKHIDTVLDVYENQYSGGLRIKNINLLTDKVSLFDDLFSKGYEFTKENVETFVLQGTLTVGGN